MQREQWIQENKVYETIMGIVRSAYNAGYLEGKNDRPETVNEIDIERRRAECQ